MDSFTDFVDEILDHFKFSNYVLAFPCVAGIGARRVAKQRKDVVGLVHIQTPDIQQQLKWVDKLDSLHLIRTPFVGQVLFWFVKSAKAQSWISYASPSKETAALFWPTVEKAMKTGCCHFCLASAFQTLDCGKYALLKDELKSKLDVKSLHFWGLKDRSHKQTDKKRALDLFTSGLRFS
jgi:hypothetical protein